MKNPKQFGYNVYWTSSGNRSFSLLSFDVMIKFHEFLWELKSRNGFMALFSKFYKLYEYELK